MREVERQERDRRRPDERHRERVVTLQDGGQDEREQDDDRRPEAHQCSEAADPTEHHDGGGEQDDEIHERCPAVGVQKGVLQFLGQVGEAAHQDLVTGIEVGDPGRVRDQLELDRPSLVGTGEEREGDDPASRGALGGALTGLFGHALDAGGVYLGSGAQHGGVGTSFTGRPQDEESDDGADGEERRYSGRELRSPGPFAPPGGVSHLRRPSTRG